MRKVLIATAILLVLIVGAVLSVGSVLWGRANEPYKGYEAPERFVEISPGTETANIGRRLVDAGVIRDQVVFRAALWWAGQERNLKAGEYRFEQPLTPSDVIDRLVRGDVYARRITFPEGLTIQEMAGIYESQGFGPARDFIEAARDTGLISALDPRAGDLEGYLFPDTYALPRGTPAARLVALMVGRFRATYTDDLRRHAEPQGLTTRQVVTLASLVEKETGKAEERPLIAAVYHNRMKRGMGLQADPTVVYALRTAGKYDGNIRKEDLNLDSPYNTYRYAGLPPGPIASPGKASLEAALMPADVPSLYFVSRNDGTHVFARTLAAHNRNVRQYQVRYFRQQSGGRGNGQGAGGREQGAGLSQGTVARE